MNRFILCVAALVTMIIQMSAQTVTLNKRFGKVSKEELEMTEYKPDSAAVAVVLYENRNIQVDLSAGGAFVKDVDVHMRIKILKEEGTEWGDFSVMKYVSQSVPEIVTGIEVVTYNLENDKVVPTKMSREFIYTEDVSSSFQKISFYAQEVKVGSVIEMKYSIHSDRFWEIDDVYFQKTIPVNWVESQVSIPGFFTFNKKLHGSLPVQYDSKLEPKNLFGYQYEMVVDKFVAVDLPAFKYEPYIYYPRQYFSFVTYDIRSLRLPGMDTKYYGVSWDDVDNTYVNSQIMTRFRAQCQFKEQVAALPEEGTDIEKIASAVSLVKDNVVWDEKYKVFPEPVGQVVKARSGSNADINCLIAGCLREMGYTVDMVLIKMRSSGMLLDFQPERNPYDTFILRVTGSDGSQYYLDGGSPHGYINVLPPDLLVTNARLVRPNVPGEWVDLTRLTRNGTTMTVATTLTDDLRLSGEYTCKETGNTSYSTKESYSESDDEQDYISDIETDLAIEIDDITFGQMKEYSSSSQTEYKFHKDLDASGDFVYINPFLVKFHSADTFQSLQREFPIDFPFTYSLTYIFTFTIPEGYAVDQIPENRIFKFQPLASTARCSCTVNGNTVQMVYNFSQNKMMCGPEYYQDIRSYWKLLADIYDVVLVLKKL
jgi:hypothetical protein